MIYSFNLALSPRDAASEERIKLRAAQELAIDSRTITALRIDKRSVDARQRNTVLRLAVRVYVNEQPPLCEYEVSEYRQVENAAQVVVVGAGPGGLFAALRLIELGLKPVVLERGKNVRERKRDIALIPKEHKINPESNYSFGEGGAGAFSDGKLYTRSKKRGSVQRILAAFCRHGAAEDILYDAHPHIGTDRLPRIIENMRNTILSCGGEVHFKTRADAILTDSDGDVCGVAASDGREYRGAVILATGHSARDVYRYLAGAGFALEMKGLAVGVRLEHPSSLIDSIQYHSRNGRGQYLPAAEYSVAAQVGGRGVYSFCMCPGGFVVPAATGARQLVVNGMSPSSRGSKWSNAGMVVEMHPEDLQEASIAALMRSAMNDDAFAGGHTDYDNPENPLRIMYFQEALERECWLQGNMKQTAPAQRMNDFVNRHLSYDLPSSSYAAGLVSSPLHFWLPAFVSSRLAEGFKAFGRRRHGFLTREAAVIGVETRTSSPVRIVRDGESLQASERRGLFPCGEGAGYAGGIVSAAIDGERCAEAAAELVGTSAKWRVAARR